MSNYVIKGDSLSLIKKKIDSLIKENHYDDASITTYDLDEDSISSLIEDADTISFLTVNKVIIGYNLSDEALSDSKHLNTLNKYLDNPNSDVLLFFTISNLDMRKKVNKELLNKLTVINLSNSPLEIIKDALKDYQVERRVLNLLEEYYKDDLERLLKEIDKLKVASLPSKKITVSLADELLIKPLNDQENLTFSLVRAIALKDKNEALTIYQELLNYNILSYSILGLLESQYRLLYQVIILKKRGISQPDIAKILDVHPFRIKKTLELVSFYTLGEVRKFLKKMALIDYNIKSGIYEDNITIDLLILNIK